MSEIEVTVRMHLHDLDCGHLQDDGEPRTESELIDYVGNWFNYEEPVFTPHPNPNFGPYEGRVYRNCQLISKKEVKDD